ncbi:MAG: FKBP-type peptidyl-prolyl cis-trans isomerase [archaeon]|jgi:FKBP-type peptidyl-prolyl cis-trans isomerase 2
MAEKKKRKMVSVNFVGKELLENAVFDTTIESEAKSAGIFDERRKYKPLDIIVGEKELLEKVENAIDEMNEGEKRIVKLLPSEAFGERNAEMLRVVPLQNFIEQKINPFPGLVVRIANAIGKVQSVSSGRVRIDFNHPLAGREVEYHVELVKEIKDKKEIAQKMYEKYYSRIPGTKHDYTEGKMIITASGDFLKNLSQVNEAIKELAKDFDLQIEFKEGIVKVEGSKANPQVTEQAHVHGPNCNHEDNAHVHHHGPNCNHDHHEHEEKEEEEKAPASSDEDKPKSIHQIADEIKGGKKSGSFDVSRDSATTIQRPKKK